MNRTFSREHASEASLILNRGEVKAETFEEFLVQSAADGHINLIFERGMYLLAEDLQKVLSLFEEAKVPFELIGGLAVNAHLMAAQERSRSFLTRDIDLLVKRSDLDQIVETAKRLRYEAKRMIGGYALIAPGQDLAESIHMLFVGEKPKSTYPAINPDLNPVIKGLFGLQIPVAPVRDIVILKLNSLRIKDLLHIQVLDSVGLITPDIEASLPEVLRQRLGEAREQFAAEEIE